jgi:hypothetical protein
VHRSGWPCAEEQGHLSNSPTQLLHHEDHLHYFLISRGCHVQFNFNFPIMTSLTRAETLGLLSLFAACVGIILNTFHGDGEPLIASLAFSGIAFALTYSLIVWLGETFMKAGLKGKDMSKLKKVEMSVYTPFDLRP